MTDHASLPDERTDQEQTQDDPGQVREFRIIVNGRPRVVHERELSFDQVVLLAFPNPHHEPGWIYTVTYSHGVGGQEGQLLPGQTVKIANGMIFNVTETNKS
jgi:hypothetical protein